MSNYVKNLIEGLKAGTISEEEAELMIRKAPYVDIDFAKVDMHRALRQGNPEVIYGAGKTPEQILEICRVMEERGQKRILITRIDEEKAAALSSELEGFEYYRE